MAAPPRTLYLVESEVVFFAAGAVRHGIPKQGLLRAACADQLGAEAPVDQLHLCDHQLHPVDWIERLAIHQKSEIHNEPTPEVNF